MGISLVYYLITANIIYMIVVIHPMVTHPTEWEMNGLTD